MDFPLINSVAALPQNTAEFTEALEQHGQIAVLHIATGTQAHIFQLRRRHLSDTGYFRQRQRPHKLCHLMGSDNELAVGFIHIGSDFSEKLHRRHARRGGEVQLPFDGLADLLSY